PAARAIFSVSPRRSPGTSASTGLSSQTTMSDLTMSPTSQPAARAASSAVAASTATSPMRASAAAPRRKAARRSTSPGNSFTARLYARFIILHMPSDLGDVFDEHVRAEFVERDLDATMATMVDEPYVTHVPVLTGGFGRDEVARFYRDSFIGRWPVDTEIVPVSRTVDVNRVVDELIVRFTHAIEIPAYL